jgi:hypothetical protein
MFVGDKLFPHSHSALVSNDSVVGVDVSEDTNSLCKSTPHGTTTGAGHTAKFHLFSAGPRHFQRHNYSSKQRHMQELK